MFAPEKIGLSLIGKELLQLAPLKKNRQLLKMDAWNFSHPLIIRKVVFQPSVFWWILAVTFREGQISGTEVASPKTSLVFFG